MPLLVATSTGPVGVPDSDMAMPRAGAEPAGLQERPPSAE